MYFKHSRLSVMISPSTVVKPHPVAAKCLFVILKLSLLLVKNIWNRSCILKAKSFLTPPNCAITISPGNYRTQLYDKQSESYLPATPGLGMFVEVKDPDEKVSCHLEG